MVYGAVDGTVTTFAIVAGATGGDLTSATIIILGFANLFADGVSMSVSAYLSARSDTSTSSVSKNPFSIALWTLVSFIGIGFIPLMPFVFGIGTFTLSCMLTGIAFLFIGSMKGLVSRTSIPFSALQTLALGTLAALIAYGVGAWLSGLQ
jgi:vacuolar iron transporter family protein